MTPYLRTHPPRVRQFRSPRREQLSGVIVLHSAENLADTIAPDHGAENVAAFIRDRTTYGSYHDLCDTDSTVHLVSYDDEAFGDGTGSNSHAIHISGAFQAHEFDRQPMAWRIAVCRQMGLAARRAADHIDAKRGIRVPARRVTRYESENRVPGFITHAERDPDRRSDPGPHFLWNVFFDAYAASGHTPTETEETDDMATIIKGDDSPHWWATDGTVKAHLVDRDVVNNLAIVGALRGKGGPEPHVLPQAVVDAIPTVTTLDALAAVEARIRSALAGSGTGLTEAQATKVSADAIREVLGGLND